MFGNRNHLIRLLFTLVIVGVYLFALGLPLLGPDEPRYAQVAREMFERGDWVTPTLGGFHWFEKPALLYWLQITFYNIFGVTEFAARLGSALFGLGTVFSLYLLGKEAESGERRTESDESKIQDPKPKTADWFALVSASSLGLLVFSRGASFDIIITFPITAALVSFFIWENRIGTGRRGDGETSSIINHLQFTIYYLPLILFYFFTGTALIAKGLIGIVFPFAIVAFYYVLRLKLPSKTFIISLFWGTALSVLVASLWYLPMYLQNGWKFIDEFFIQHHFQRYTSNKYKHPQPFWFFWVIFPLFTIPWLPFFFASIGKNVKDSFFREKADEQSGRRSKIQNPESKIRCFAVAWMFVPLVFFSLSGSKLPGYILPSLPGACLLTGAYVAGLAEKSLKWKNALTGLGLLMFLVVALLLQFVVPGYAELDSTRHLIETAAAKGYKTEKILNLHTISHNIEFYGNGRLVREKNGTQKRFGSVEEIAQYLKAEPAEKVLVLVPNEFLDQLTKSEIVRAELLDKTGELDLVLVRSVIRDR